MKFIGKRCYKYDLGQCRWFCHQTLQGFNTILVKGSVAVHKGPFLRIVMIGFLSQQGLGCVKIDQGRFSLTVECKGLAALGQSNVFAAYFARDVIQIYRKRQIKDPCNLISFLALVHRYTGFFGVYIPAVFDVQHRVARA